MLKSFHRKTRTLDRVFTKGLWRHAPHLGHFNSMQEEQKATDAHIHVRTHVYTQRRAHVEVRSVDDYQSIRQRARGHRWHRSFMDICGLSPSSSWMMHYLYVAARIAYIVITGVTHYRWGGSTRRRRFATKFCEEYISVDGTGSIFIFEFTILAPHPSILSRPFELRRLADRINLIAEHGFRFLHSMIDRSIDRSSFSSIFKSNYFFFFMKITKMIYHGIFFFLILR